MSFDEIKSKLEEELHIIEWAALKPHSEKGSLILVQPGVDLTDLGAHVALDNTDFVKPLLDSGKMKKVESEDLADVEQDASKQYAFIIVQPYVFAQIAAN